MELTGEQAQVIVDKLMTDISYNINIMDKTGKIIASGDKKRIGHLHAGAQTAIQYQKMIEIYEDSAFNKKGTNEPIVLNNQIIGVIGISGEPAEVRPFTNIVKTVVSLFLEELSAYKIKEKDKLNKKNFFAKLISLDGKYDQVIRKQALETYHLDLSGPNKGIACKDAAQLKNLFPEKEIFSFNHLYIVFFTHENIHVPASCERTLILSEPAANLKSIVDQLWNVYCFTQFLQLESPFIDCKNFSFYSKLCSKDMVGDERLLKKIDTLDDELFSTTIAFFKNNGKFTLSADFLHIHRNTLQYRLKRVSEKTGKNPCINFELMELIYYMFFYYKQNYLTG